MSKSSSMLRAVLLRSSAAPVLAQKGVVGEILRNYHPSISQRRYFASGLKKSEIKCTEVNNLSPDVKAKIDEDLDGVYVLPHFKSCGDAADWRLPHPVWTAEEMDAVKNEHLSPKGFLDWSAYCSVMGIRRLYDLVTGYALVRQNENAYLRRVIFLETVAGVPGMVGAMIRHMRSLRTMERDYGWIHTLLEEAENERMHLMTAMLLRDPSFLVKANVLIAQGIFLPIYTLLYAVSPRFCHRFVGYLEEQAVKTYTHIVEQIDQGELPGFLVEAPGPIRKYWKLPEGATLRDVFLAMRADEAHHREVNHTFAEVSTMNAINPFPPGF